VGNISLQAFAQSRAEELHKIRSPRVEKLAYFASGKKNTTGSIKISTGGSFFLWD